MPNNRHEPVPRGSGFDLIELTNGCSLRVQSATMSKGDRYGSQGGIGPDAVHVWWASPDVPAYNGACIEDVLDPVEVNRALRFVRDSDRRHFVTARACLRSLVGSYQGIDPREVRFLYGQHGKPTLVRGGHATDLCFNLSHAQDLIVYAFVRGRAVGVDLECVREDSDIEMLMPLVFSNRELDAVRKRASGDRRDTFYRVWVAKEAYVKATGLGLSLDLTKVHIEWDNPEEGGVIEVAEKPEEQERWCLRMLPAPSGYYAALVVEAGRDYSKESRVAFARAGFYSALRVATMGTVRNEHGARVECISGRP